MMVFIMMTISFTLAILLASGLAVWIMLQPKVLEWYTKKVFKMMNDLDKVLDKVQPPEDL